MAGVARFGLLLGAWQAVNRFSGLLLSKFDCRPRQTSTILQFAEIYCDPLYKRTAVLSKK